MKQILSKKEAIDLVKEGSSIMVGGFLNCGVPDKLIDELSDRKISNLTMICNDTSYPNTDKGKLIVNRQVKKLVTTHIGTNPETGRQMNSGELDIELVPMGTFVERIRAKGAGLGGILTQTGIGTIIEENKEIMTVDDKKFIFEKPIGADIALIYGTKVDKFGNVAYYGTTRNCNTVMATAADTVVVQADEMVDCIDPNDVIIPGVFVDYIVLNEDK